MRSLAIVLGVLVWNVSAARAQTELRNDGFNDGDPVGFQAGFVAGEIGASRFVASDPGLQLLKVHALFGGASTTQTVTLHVWDDTAGGTSPGTELYSGDFQLTGSDTQMQELDLTASNVVVTQQFRVGLEFQHTGLPSIARDDDGTIAAGRNYIDASGIGWVQSSTLGLTGDWIIRAVVSGGGGPTPDAGPGGPDAGSGGSCTATSQCAEGEYCDPTAHVCTFDCRQDSDCGGADTCNSLGQCVAGSSGCCDTGGSAPLGVTAMWVVGLAFVLRRRRA